MENLVRLAVWPAVLALAAGTAALIVVSDVTDSPGLTAALTLVVGLSWSTIGLVQRLRRPANRLGSLMLVFGFVWFAGRWIYVSPSLLYTIGLFLGAVFFAVLGHVRSVLLPSAMKLLGERSWYFPSWLSWLPRLQIEAPAPAPAAQRAPM